MAMAEDAASVLEQFVQDGLSLVTLIFENAYFIGNSCQSPC